MCELSRLVRSLELHQVCPFPVSSGSQDVRSVRMPWRSSLLRSQSFPGSGVRGPPEVPAAPFS